MSSTGVGPESCRSPMPLTFPPAQKAPSVPVRIRASISLRPLTSAVISSMQVRNSAVKGLCCRGRAMVAMPMPVFDG